MRKAFKVATVFTGAAACAAAFTPAAMAATVRPDTSHRNCAGGGQLTTSMVFVWPSAAHHGPTCVGGANGTGWTHLGTDYISFCAGNNSGSMKVSGSTRKFHEGQISPLYSDHVSSVRITKYGLYADYCYIP